MFIHKHLPIDIKMNILSYVIDYEYKLLEWIDPVNIDINNILYNINGLTFIKKYKHKLTHTLWGNLCYNPNPNVIYFLLENNRQIYYSLLSENKYMINYIKKNIDKFDIFDLISNPNARNITYKYVMEYIYDINNKYMVFGNKKIEKKLYEYRFWFKLSSNENYVDVLENNISKINWVSLSKNKGALKILKENINMIYWIFLSENSGAIEIIEQYLDKIYWDKLCKNPSAIHILEKYPDKINWKYLSLNPNAIHLLKNNINEISWSNISKNPAIFEIDNKKTMETIYNLL